MAVESATNIADLNPANPTGADPKSAGDDHIRLVKAVLRQSFAGFAGAVLVTGADGGAANAYTVTPSTALTAYASKMLVEFSPTVTNTGAATLAVSGLAAKNLLAVDGSALVAGDLVAGRVYLAFYDGTSFRLAAITKNYIDQLVVGTALPGVTNPANADKFYHTDGSAGGWSSVDGRGAPLTALGNSGTGTVVCTYSDHAEGWTLTATGSFTLTATGFPSGRLAGGLLKIANAGAYAITSTGITWIKSDGTQSTSFASAGYTPAASGANHFALWSYGDGTVYGRMV